MSSLSIPAPSPGVAVYFRWSAILGAMVEATWAKGFSAPGFDDCRLFTSAEVDPSEGEYAFRVYEGRAGLAVGPFARFRGNAEAAGRRALRAHGRVAFDQAVADALSEREANRAV